jgi:hypothetical protein
LAAVIGAFLFSIASTKRPSVVLIATLGSEGSGICASIGVDVAKGNRVTCGSG